MKKVLVLIISVLTVAALTVGCAGKDASQETSAAEPAETVQQAKETTAAAAEAGEKETRTQKNDAEVDEDYSNAMGDSDEFLVDCFGEATSQKDNKGIVIAEYSNNDHKATFHVAVEYEEDEEPEGPDDMGEIPDGVVGGTRDLDMTDAEPEEEYAYREVFYAQTTAGDLFNMKNDTIAIDELLRILKAEEVNKSADGRKLTFMSDGYGFAVTLSDPETISKDDDAVIVSEEHFGDIK